MAELEYRGSLSDWKFHNYRVQKDMVAGQFINAESTLIAAGKPNISAGSSTNASNSSGNATPDTFDVFPIGLLETFGLQQSKQLQRIFEIGSSRSYFIPGRTIGSVSLGRTFYFGPSLLKVLYAYFSTSNKTNEVEGLMTTPSVSDIQVNRSPGKGNFYIDLASDLFNQPTGMAIYFKDAYETTYGGFYLEECYVQGHQMTVSSGSVLIMEGVSVQYDLLVPLSF